jgi:hypothetical protein
MFHPQESMRDQHSYFLTKFDVLFYQLLQIGFTAVVSNQNARTYIRNKEYAIELIWVWVLLEMNQVRMRAVHHFFFNLLFK